MMTILNTLISDPLVSVIIPSYNRIDKVSYTLDSILSQKCDFEFEIIIGDDCSTDGVRELLKEYQHQFPEKIKLIFHEENIGLAANWATCVKECRGKYITNCDNDDYWHNENKLQLQVDFMESHPDIGMCHTNYRIHNRDRNTIIEVKGSKDTEHGVELQKKVFGPEFKCCNATVMYRSNMLRKYVNFEDYIKYQFTLQDWNTWIILAAYVDFYCLDISTATFGIETVSITRPDSYEKILKRFEKERECYIYVCNLFPKIFPYKKEEYDNYINKVLFNLAVKKKDYKKAKELYQKKESKGIKKIIMLNELTFSLFSILKNIKNR